MTPTHWQKKVLEGIETKEFYVIKTIFGSVMESEEHNENFKLTELPPEILIHIFGFLDAGYVRTVLSRVNRRLAQLVTDPIIWKLRIGKFT